MRYANPDVFTSDESSARYQVKSGSAGKAMARRNDETVALATSEASTNHIEPPPSYTGKPQTPASQQEYRENLVVVIPVVFYS